MSKPFSEATKDFDPEQLTEGQRKALEVSRMAMGPDFVPDPETQGIMEGDGVLAGYKIELHFGKDRTVHGPNVVCIQAFESGKRLNGGGDDLMYWCKDVREGHDDGCWGPIPGSWIQGPIAMCQNCGAAVKAEYLTGQRFMKVPTNVLADHVAKIWRQLKMNADIYCKFHPEDIRYKVIEQKRGAAEARRLRGLFIYPLANILKDTAAGATVEGRFAAFFKA
jgi:hypothetical protein